MSFGVYALVFNTDDGEYLYIGATDRNFSRRLTEHKHHLKKGIHGNKNLQIFWDRYKSFEFRILEKCSSRDEVYEAETRHINGADKARIINTYACSANPCSRKKYYPTQEVREKMSKAHFKGNGRRAFPEI